METQIGSKSLLDLTAVFCLDLVFGPHSIIRRAEELRNAVRWVPVPVLRNRQRVLFGVFESPFDTFGPVPPLDPYEEGYEAVTPTFNSGE